MTDQALEFWKSFAPSLVIAFVSIIGYLSAFLTNRASKTKDSELEIAAVRREMLKTVYMNLIEVETYLEELVIPGGRKATIEDLNKVLSMVKRLKVESVLFFDLDVLCSGYSGEAILLARVLVDMGDALRLKEKIRPQEEKIEEILNKHGVSSIDEYLEQIFDLPFEGVSRDSIRALSNTIEDLDSEIKSRAERVHSSFLLFEAGLSAIAKDDLKIR